LKQEAVRERKEEKEMIAILESKPELLVLIDKKKEMQIITETRKASHNPMQRPVSVPTHCKRERNTDKETNR